MITFSGMAACGSFRPPFLDRPYTRPPARGRNSNLPAPNFEFTRPLQHWAGKHLTLNALSMTTIFSPGRIALANDLLFFKNFASQAPVFSQRYVPPPATVKFLKTVYCTLPSLIFLVPT